VQLEGLGKSKKFHSRHRASNPQHSNLYHSALTTIKYNSMIPAGKSVLCIQRKGSGGVGLVKDYGAKIQV
jgi:hypothetical protein